MNLSKLPPDLNLITRPNWIEINLDALASNIQFVRKSIPKQTKILLPVKADSYGHGSLACAYAAKYSGADQEVMDLAENLKKLEEDGLTELKKYLSAV